MNICICRSFFSYISIKHHGSQILQSIFLSKEKLHSGFGIRNFGFIEISRMSYYWAATTFKNEIKVSAICRCIRSIRRTNNNKINFKEQEINWKTDEILECRKSETKYDWKCWHMFVFQCLTLWISFFILFFFFFFCWSNNNAIVSCLYISNEPVCKSQYKIPVELIHIAEEIWNKK